MSDGGKGATVLKFLYSCRYKVCTYILYSCNEILIDHKLFQMLGHNVGLYIAKSRVEGLSSSCCVHVDLFGLLK